MASFHSDIHPCQRCGACCAQYRVRFYWREAEPNEQHSYVPPELTEDYSPFERVMKGTNNKHSCRCVALEGKLGEEVGCAIYTSRPSPCRAFQASFESGVHQPRCDQARARYHLPPLTRKDWGAYCGPTLALGDSAARLENDESENYSS